MAENYLSKFDVEANGGTTAITLKDAGARSLVAQEIADRSALIKTDESGNTIISTGEKIVESSHDKETTIIGTNSTHVNGTNTINIGGAHTEVYGSTYGKTVTGKSTVHYNGGREEVHKLPAKIAAPDLTLDIANGITYKKPTKYNDYFKSVVAKDTDGNAYNILVASDSTADLGSAAPYHSFKEFGIDNTGVTDCSDALAGITDNVALSAGTYLISKNCTISAQIAFAKGALLSISANVTVTINGTITAPDTQIFGGEGDVTIATIANASWFPTINKAFSSLTSGTLYITKEFTTDTVINISNSIRIIGLSKSSAIVTDANLPILLNIGGTTSNKLVYVYMNNIKVRNNGDCAINIHDCSFSIFEDIHVINSTVGIKVTNTNSCKILRPIVESVIDKNQTGILLDCTEYTNNSLIIEGCNILENNNPSKNNTTGIIIKGAILNDLWLDGCETSQCNLGLAIIGSGTTVAYDINIRNCIFDQCLSCGIQLKSLKGSPFSSCVLENCYITMAEGATIQSVNANDCENIIITNLICYNTGNTGLDIADCKNMTISDSTVIVKGGYGIVTENATKNFCISNTHVINKGSACDIGLALRGSYNIANSILFTGIFNTAILNDGNKDIISNIVGENCTNILQDTSGNSLSSNIMTN